MSNWVRRVAALALALALAGVACDRDEPADSGTPSTTGAPGDRPGGESDEGGFPSAYSNLRKAYAHMFETGDALATAIDAHKNLPGDVKSRSSDLLVTLDRLFGEDFLLTGFAMQKGLDGAPDFQALDDALDGNSKDLAEVFGSIYGEENANAFLEQWREQVRMLVDLTVATAKNDKADRQQALDELGASRKSVSEFLSRLTGAPASDVGGLIQGRSSDLTTALDAYQRKDYAGAYSQLRTGHLSALGSALAGAISRQERLPGDPDVPATGLREGLDRLLGEHAVLAAFAMQKGFGDTPDFGALAEALDKNSVALGDAIGSVYGEGPRGAFLTQWREHIRMFIDYTKATAAKDEVKRDAAFDQLSAYRQSFAGFLATTTGSSLPAASVADLLQVHIDQLTAALAAYAAANSP